MLNTQAERDAEALAEIGDIAWAALVDTDIPQGQLAEAVGAIIEVMGQAYMKDRATYLSPDPVPQERPDPGTM